MTPFNTRSTKLSFAMLLLVVLFCLSACSTAPKHVIGDNYEYTKEYMSRYITSYLSENDAPSISIALIDGDQPQNPIVWAQSFGYADVENKTPATPNTVYRAGSITKVFTALAIMQLVEQGKIDLDAPIQTYLPKITINNRFNKGTVTVRNMLTHHSGLPSDDMNRIFGDASITPSYLAHSTFDLTAEPNTMKAYSNIAFTLLGRVIENVSKTPYEEYVQTHILNPIGMKDSNISVGFNNRPNHAKGYFQGKHYDNIAIGVTPAGGLNTNAQDLAKFVLMTFNGGKANGQQIIKPSTLKAMQSKQFNSNSLFADNDNIGLAWIRSDKFNHSTHHQSGTVIGHNGGTAMFGSEMWTLPKHKLAVIVFTNDISKSSEDGNTVHIAKQALKLALASKTGIKFKPKEVELAQSIPAHPEDLKHMPGKWNAGEIMEIKRKGDKLIAKVDGVSLNLVHKGNREYFVEYRKLGLSLNIGEMGETAIKHHTVNGREVLSLTSLRSQDKMFVEKVTPHPITENWKQLLGEYTTESKGIYHIHSMNLEHKDGLLRLSGEMSELDGPKEAFTIYLNPINDHQAVIYGVGRSTGDLITFKKQSDGRISFIYSGYEAVKTQ